MIRKDFIQKALAVFISLLAATASLAQGDESGCGAILRSGVVTTNTLSSTARNDAVTYQKACKLDWDQSDESQRGQAEIEVFGTGKGGGSVSSEKRKQELRSRCDELYQSARSDAAVFQQIQTYNNNANEAFVSCKKIERESGFKITPSIAPGGRTVTVAMAYRGGVRGGVAVYLPVATNFSCEVRGPGNARQSAVSEKATIAVVQNEAITFICKRTYSSELDPADKSAFRFYPEATLTIATAEVPFQITFPEERDPGLSVQTQRRVLEMAKRTPPVGTVVAFAGRASASEAVKTNEWLVCDGRTLARSRFPELSAAIGSTWGGTEDSFKLPDLRGQYLRGEGAGFNGGDSAASVGNYQKMDTAPHSHSAKLEGNGSLMTSVPLSLSPELPTGLTRGAEFSDSNTAGLQRQPGHTVSVNSAVGTETRPITAVVTWLIRAK